MRNPSIDIMKGLAILLVLIGHMAIPADGFFNKFIYSFHMPLFFIVSGYFAKSLQEMGVSIGQALKKDSLRLLLPYFITVLAIVSFTALRSILKSDWSIVIDRACGLLYVTYDAAPIWFLVALFWCRLCFRPMMKLGRWSMVVAVFVSGISILIAHHYVQLPLCILTALSAIVFYAMGWYYKWYGFPKWLIGIAVLCWPIVIMGDRIDIYCLKYGIYPLTILGAGGATYVISKACALFVRTVDNLKARVNGWGGMCKPMYVCMYVCMYVVRGQLTGNPMFSCL